MALLLDTEKIVPVARRDAVHDAYLRADVPRQVSLTSQQAIDSTRIEAWMLGSTKLFCVECPGMKVVRAAPSGRLDPMIALCIQGRGTGLSIEDGRQQQLMTGDLLMVGPTSPNEFLINGATSALELPFDEVGVSVETARKASERLPASPLYPLVARYLVSLRHDVDSISSSAAAATVGVATSQLVRALIVSAALDERAASSALDDALAPRIFAYVRQHLTDRDLTPLKIAREHSISLRYLYKLCATDGVTLVDRIIEERLEGARRDLASPQHFPVSIARIAHKWGFKDPSHFSKRFRQSYGLSPREFLRYPCRHDREIL